MAAAVLNAVAIRPRPVSFNRVLNWTIAISILLHFAIGWYFVRGLVGDMRVQLEPEAIPVVMPPRVIAPPPPPPPPEVQEDKIIPKAPIRTPVVQPTASTVEPAPIAPSEPAPVVEAPVGAAPPAPAVAPKPTRRVQPTYPRKAAEREVSGYATVQITIAAGGTVTEVAVVDESPRGYRFGEAAADAVYQWEFASAAPGTYRVTVRFDIQ